MDQIGFFGISEQNGGFCVITDRGPAFGRGRTETERSERNEKVSAKQYSLAADGDAATISLAVTTTVTQID